MYHFICRGLLNPRYINDCVGSLATQTIINWHAHLIIDNCPTIQFLDYDNRVSVNFSPDHKGVCQNMYYGIKNCGAEDEDVICILDLDDKLKFPHSLQIVDDHYNKYPNLLCTYGSFEISSTGKIHHLCKAHSTRDLVRSDSWHASHLKTFKFKVFKHVPMEYFMHKGKWGQGASDLALMFSILELCGIENSHFIKEPIYWYRYPTPTTCNRKVQIKWRDRFRKKKPLAQQF